MIIELITSREQLCEVVQQIALVSPRNGLPESVVAEALDGFLKHVYSKDGQFVVAFIDTRDRLFPPTLSIGVRWPRPVNLRADGGAIRELWANQTDFASTLRPQIPTFMRVFDPRGFPSPELFQNNLIADHYNPDSERMVACVQFPEGRSR